MERFIHRSLRSMWRCKMSRETSSMSIRYFRPQSFNAVLSISIESIACQIIIPLNIQQFLFSWCYFPDAVVTSFPFLYLFSSPLDFHSPFLFISLPIYRRATTTKTTRKRRKCQRRWATCSSRSPAPSSSIRDSPSTPFGESILGWCNRCSKDIRPRWWPMKLHQNLSEMAWCKVTSFYWMSQSPVIDLTDL